MTPARMTHMGWAAAWLTLAAVALIIDGLTVLSTAAIVISNVWLATSPTHVSAQAIDRSH